MSDISILKRMFEQNFKLNEPIDSTLKPYEACYFNGTVWTNATALIPPTGFLAEKLVNDVGNIALGSEVPVETLTNTALSTPVIANAIYHYDPVTRLLNTTGTGWRVGTGYAGASSESRYGSIIVNINQGASGASANVKSGIITIPAIGAGTSVITGIGFTPKSIRILAFIQANARISSDGINTTGLLVSTMQSSRNNTGDFGNFLDSVNIISVRDYFSGTNENLATLASIDADGFTLNISSNPNTLQCIYTCIG